MAAAVVIRRNSFLDKTMELEDIEDADDYRSSSKNSNDDPQQHLSVDQKKSSSSLERFLFPSPPIIDISFSDEDEDDEDEGDKYSYYNHDDQKQENEQKYKLLAPMTPLLSPSPSSNKRARRLFDKQEYDSDQDHPFDHTMKHEDHTDDDRVLSVDTKSVLKRIKLEVESDLIDFTSDDEEEGTDQSRPSTFEDEIKWHDTNMSLLDQNICIPSPLPMFDDTKTPIRTVSTNRMDFFSKQFDRIWSLWFSYRVPDTIQSQSEKEYKLYRYHSSSNSIPSKKFSSLFGVAITIVGQRFASIEHYYQWMKQNWIGHADYREAAMDLIVEDSTRILMAMEKADINSDILLMLHKAGLGAKKVALQCDKSLKDDEEYQQRVCKWNEEYGQAERVLLRACLEKYVRNGHFSNILKQTGEAYLSCALEGKTSNNTSPLSGSLKKHLKWSEVCVDLSNPCTEIDQKSFEYKSTPKRRLRDALHKIVLGENKAGKMLMFIRDIVIPQNLFASDQEENV